MQFYCKDCYASRAARTYRERQLRKGKVVRERVEVPERHKYCPRCDEIKPYSEWHKNSKQSGGLAGYCKKCRSELGRVGHLKRTFGLTPDELGALIQGQGGTCAICDGPPQHIDHETGKVRGVLCGPCNMGLGQFGDDPERLSRASRYLRRHGLRAAAAVDEYPAPEHVIFEVDYRHRSA